MRELLLRAVPFFDSLAPADLATLAASLPVANYTAPSMLFEEGDVGHCFYIILEGKVAIIKSLGTPDERLVEVHGAGEFVGEMSLLEPDGLRSASAYVQQDAQVLELSRATFDALLERHPQLAYTMLRVVSARLRLSQDSTVRDLHERNERLACAYAALQAAQAQLVEKEALERELGVAREIQQSMLPHTLPRLPGYDIGALMAPAREVAGDFFDIIPLAPGRLGLVVGDVCGKGVPAALFMALTRALLRAEVAHTSSPAEVLRHLNQQLPELSSAGLFVTLLYGILDQTDNTFSYVRAGHELPLGWDAARTPLLITRSLGQPLGLIPEPALDVQTIALPMGSSLLLITDGVSEAAAVDGQLFGLERVDAVIRAASPDESAQAICERLLDVLTAYRGAEPQSDDITLVAVRRVSG